MTRLQRALKPQIFLRHLHADIIFAVHLRLNQYRAAANGAVFGVELRFRWVDKNGDALPAEGAGDLLFKQLEVHNQSCCEVSRCRREDVDPLARGCGKRVRPSRW